MDDLIAFLRARLDEREGAARTAQRAPWGNDDGTVRDSRGVDVADWTSSAEHLVLNDPAFVLADVAAKRQIVKLHKPCTDEPECHVCGPHGSAGACLTLCLLALPYADHPDYREEWRP